LNGNYYLRDEGSLNGTFFKIESMNLSEGDLVEIGETLLKFQNIKVQKK
jgi:hypothetical protein